MILIFSLLREQKFILIIYSCTGWAVSNTTIRILNIFIPVQPNELIFILVIEANLEFFHTNNPNQDYFKLSSLIEIKKMYPFLMFEKNCVHNISSIVFVFNIREDHEKRAYFIKDIRLIHVNQSFITNYFKCSH